MCEGYAKDEDLKQITIDRLPGQLYSNRRSIEKCAYTGVIIINLSTLTVV